MYFVQNKKGDFDLKKSIDKAVIELTEEQKNKISLIYKIRLGITIAVFTTMALFMVNCNETFSDFTVDSQVTDALLKKFIAVIIISFAFVGAIYLYIKIKYPYFSKKTYKTIMDTPSEKDS